MARSKRPNDSDHERTQRAHPGVGPTVRRLCLRVHEGPDAGRTFEPSEGRLVSVGAAENNEIVLSDPQVSRYHVELQATAEGIHVRDLGSLNGTSAGAFRIESGFVPAGTRLRLGATIVSVQDRDLIEPADPEAAPQIAGLVGNSPAIVEVRRMVARLAGSDVSVLIQGETGTGKELVARATHETGPRKDRPFEIVDSGSMLPTLIASELFGHERGAFTGADSRRAGAFERARGGTVFLDEIGELPLAVQPALLGVLERRRYRRVGGDKELTTTARVVAATHRDLRAQANDGTFRADLYYRLAVARIVVPALRERPEDIEPLLEHFVEEAAGSAAASPFSPRSVETLRTQRWSGNVRELRNVVEAALAMGRVTLDGGAPPSAASEPPPGDSPDAGPLPVYRDARTDAIARFEADYLGRLIRECEGNASEAARRAKMDRPYLITLLRKHGLR